jgi:hypothetical protein
MDRKGDGLERKSGGLKFPDVVRDESKDDFESFGTKFEPPPPSEVV